MTFLICRHLWSTLPGVFQPCHLFSFRIDVRVDLGASVPSQMVRVISLLGTRAEA